MQTMGSEMSRLSRAIQNSAAALLLLAASGCAVFYDNPGKDDPGATFIERSEWNGLSAGRSTRLAEIDGKPVSHMGAFGENWEIRVAPGTRRILFSVRYRSTVPTGFMQTDWHEVRFALILAVEAGKRYRLSSTTGPNELVTFTITDLSDPSSPWVERTATAVRLIPNTTVGLAGGGFVTIPAKQRVTTPAFSPP